MDGDYTFGEAGGRGMGRSSGPNPSEFVKNATNVRLPKATKVKNKQPAPVQITAEQIVREAKDFQVRRSPRTAYLSARQQVTAVLEALFALLP